MKSIVRFLIHALPLAALLVAIPSHALYKVIGPDGKVTYSDTPPQASGNKVTRLGASNNVIEDTTLPLEVRQATSRYPVMLYGMKACDPCEAGRQLLRQRGIPFTEKLILTAEDGDALQRLFGGRDAPVLTIGAQVLRGLSPDVWNSYLDSAGYPRESRLPPSYQYPTALPLTEPAAPAPVARRPVEPAPRVEPQPEPASPTGIRF
jgi:glutaredoxin